MRITMVKKILADGSPCRKCAEVETRLRDSGHLNRIDSIVIADERDPDSEGQKLARRHGVELAPFFIVEQDDGSTRVYTIFLRFLREVLQGEANASDEVQEIMERGPNLDFL
ncbi:MAG: hypothetical protein A3H91_08865 [Gammaproteobacteria bacterium RIFCSPLOWO2_02_FULL_61_13]|nr:MAG: hypothetical protein A3H91_08865 [Gammaproteobacteria bacterium RIFCSPLOWO2_02_FULL_61_13]